jgi:hypothetical protein
LGLEFLKNFLADGIVDFVQRREVEIRARQSHHADTVLGRERGSNPRLMEFRDDGAHRCRIGGMYIAREISSTNWERISPSSSCIGIGESRGIGGLGNVDILGHATPRRFDRIAQLVCIASRIIQPATRDAMTKMQRQIQSFKSMNVLGVALVAAMAWSAAAHAADCPRKGTLGTSRILRVDAATTLRSA